VWSKFGKLDDRWVASLSENVNYDEVTVGSPVDNVTIN